MPRGDQMADRPELTLAHLLLLAEEKAGKTDWALRAAESGFNVLMLDGDVAAQRIADLTAPAKSRVYYMDVSDSFVGDVDPRMIQTVADFMVATRFLWNDTTQREYSRSKDPHDPESGACLHEIWEIRPGKLDHTWVLIIDSWTTLSYSATVAKAQDMDVSVADVEKIEQNIYQGVGNRLTNIAITQQKARCHTIITGHPSQYEKRKNPSGRTVQETKQKEQIIEWTKMVPKSSSNPHGFGLGKFFSDIGWIDVDRSGKRTINFMKTSDRTSGGALNTKGDPRVDHRFEDVVRKIGGQVPDGKQGPGEALVIHPAGTYIPVAKAAPLGIKSAQSKASESSISVDAKPATIKGLGGLAQLKQNQAGK